MRKINKQASNSIRCLLKHRAYAIASDKLRPCGLSIHPNPTQDLYGPSLALNR